MTKTAKRDWTRLDSMTNTQVRAKALANLDTQPLTDADMARMHRVSRAKTLHRAFGLTQQEFVVRHQIPLGTLRDWTQGRAEPDQSLRVYLKAMAGDAAAQRAMHSAALSPQ